MARNRRHSIEFQDEACKLVSERGYSQSQAAEELGIIPSNLSRWLKKRGLLQTPGLAGADSIVSDDPKLLRARISDLEKQLRRAETEKEILKKAAAYFASQSL
jgi:transposase